MKVHPFMWAKNTTIRDWREVVSPKFLNELGGKANMCTLAAASGAPLAADEIRWLSGSDPATGKAVDVLFRRKPSGLLDAKGAPWDFVEGVVLDGRDPGFDPKFAFTSEHFDQVHEAMKPTFDKFRKATTWSEPDATFGSIELKSIEGGTPLRVQHADNKFCPPLQGNKLAAKWTERISKAWARPEVRGAVICGAVAAVAVGAYIAACRYQHKRDERQAASIQR